MKNKPSIGLVHYTYPPIIGGVEKIVFDHAQLFAKYGYDTNIFAGEGKNDNKLINLVIVPEFRSLGITNPILREEILTQDGYPPGYHQLKDVIYEKIETFFKSVDIFFIHNILTFTFNPCLNAAFIDYINNHKEKKFVAWIHDVILDSMRKKKTFNNKSLAEMLYKPLDGVKYVGISNFLKKTLVEDIGFPSSLITIIPNGIDIPTLLNLHQQTLRIIPKYRMLDVDPLIFLPTKIMKHKNIDLCLKILFELKQRGLNPMLIITAKNFPHHKDISYLDYIDDIINKLGLIKNVIFLHNEVEEKYRDIEYKIVDDFYRLSDIVFFLSSYENFGLPLLESGITKTPILVSNLEVFKEIESENIFYADIENENSQKIAEKVVNILKSNKQISFFRKVKRAYNFDSIFQTKIIPFINEIWKK